MIKILLLAVLTLTLVCNGQEINYSKKKSRLFKELYERTKLVKTFPDNEGGFYTVRHYNEYIPNASHDKSKGFIVQHWDNKQNSLSYKNYKIQTNKKGHISGVFLNQDKLHVLESVKNKKDKTLDCFVHIAIPNKSNFTRKKIFSVSVEKFPGFIGSALNNNIDRDHQGNITFSLDKKNIVFNIDSYEKDQEKHKVLIFNENLELMWDKEFTHPSKDKLFDLKQIKVDNNGTVFILGKIYHEKRKTKKRGEINYHFELFKITKDSTKVTNLYTNKNFIKTLDIELNDDKINCIGFYSNIGDDKLIGTSFFSIDNQSMNLLNSNFQKFPTDFIFDKYGSGDNFQDELKNYRIDNIKNLDDDGYIITAEEFYISTYYHTNGSSSSSFNFDDIIILRLSKTGELMWARNINKKQKSGNYLNKVLSYNALFKDNNVYLFLNAHKKMGELSENREHFKSGFFGTINKNNSNLYIIKFNEKGEWNSSIIQQNKTSDVIYRMYNSKIETPNNSKIIFFGSNEKLKQFLTIELNN